MVNEWKDVSLGEVIKLQRGHDLTEKARKPGKIPVMGSAGQNGYHNISKTKGPGIVLGPSGASFGKVHFCKSNYWPHNTALYVTDFLGNDELFIFYFLKTIDFSYYKSGSAQPSLNRNHIYLIPVRIPPFPEQKSIAHILGSLDKKIELNRQMNATLEGMAQALFKSWFVDFDPVIDNALAAGNPIPEAFFARAETRRKALADGTANRDVAKQFPPAFKFTKEMGWIPKGWEVSTIGEQSTIVGGGTPSTKNPNFWEDGVYPWVTPKDFSSLQDKVLLSSSRYLTEEGLKKINSGLLPKGTVLMSSRAPVGYLAITQIETAINQGFIAMKCNGHIPSEYILQWANSIMDDIQQASSGSTFAEISKKVFKPFKILVPRLNSISAYTDIVNPIYTRISENIVKNKTLSSLRDTLLPKLISGELRVNV
nr:restriction endonuclease subunit S [uncultured Desulfobacter sp.]